MPVKKAFKKKAPKKKPVMKKSEIAKIAKASVKQMAEKKYFATSIVETSPEPCEQASRNYISALGFSTTNAIDPATIKAVPGGGSLDMEFPENTQIAELNMLTPYLESEPIEQLQAFAPDGKMVQPVTAVCNWYIQRDYSELLASPEGSTTPTFNDEILRNLYVDVRMIQVTPRIAPGTSGTDLDPRFDLFVDNMGNATGIDASNVLPIADNTEMFNNKVNKRRYEVIADRKYCLGNSLNIQYSRSHLNDSSSAARYDPQVANVNKDAELRIKTYHKLSQRKNGKVYYDELVAPEGGVLQPTNGHRREYVFFLFKYRSGDKLIQAIGTGNVNKITPCEMIVKCIPVSKFIDV